MTRTLLSAVAAVALALPLPVVAAAAPPEIVKVEPPSWWPGHSINPVRLLVRGKNLLGAEVTSAAAGLKTGPVKVNEAGTYLFVDVTIDPKAAPGPRAIGVRTAAGTATIPLEILEPLPRQGRFQGFSPDDAIYLLMPDRFANGDPGNDDPAVSKGLLDRTKGRYYHGGDLRGVMDRLPYLKDLGVTAIWLNPWYDNVNHLNERETYDGQAITDYHGYGAVDFYAVEERLGDLATLREMVDRAHALGIKVIQDQVANHSGPYHPWVTDSPTPTWYYGTQAKHLANTWQTWTLQDPHSPPEVQKATLEGWFIDILPDLDQDDPEVARYTIQNTLWWVGVSGLDGIRQDTLPYVHRRFWKEWMARDQEGVPGPPGGGGAVRRRPRARLVLPGRRGALRRRRLRGRHPLRLPDVLQDPRRLREERLAAGRGDDARARPPVRDASSLVTFLGLHDVPRFMNEPGAQVASLKSAFTFLATARGTPLVYYGDEIALPGGGDPDNRRDFPGGWKGDARNAFEAAGRTADEESVHAHVRALLRLRQETPALRRGKTVNLHVADRSWAYARVLDGRAVVVAINTDAAPVTLDLPASPAGLAEGTRLRDRVGALGEAAVEGGRLRLTLPPGSSGVFVP